MWNRCLISTPLQQPCHHTGVQLLCLYAPDCTMVSILHVQEPHTPRGHLYLCQPVPCSIYQHVVIFPLVTHSTTTSPATNSTSTRPTTEETLDAVWNIANFDLSQFRKTCTRTWNTVYYVTLVVLGGGVM